MKSVRSSVNQTEERNFFLGHPVVILTGRWLNQYANADLFKAQQIMLLFSETTDQNLNKTVWTCSIARNMSYIFYRPPGRTGQDSPICSTPSPMQFNR